MPARHGRAGLPQAGSPQLDRGHAIRYHPRKEDPVPIKDPDIFRIIEKIGDHFQNNVSNRFIRKALVVLELQQSEWDRLDNLTSKTEYYKQQGFQFDELYDMVIASAHFIHQARTKMVPNL